MASQLGTQLSTCAAQHLPQWWCILRHLMHKRLSWTSVRWLTHPVLSTIFHYRRKTAFQVGSSLYQRIHRALLFKNVDDGLDRHESCILDTYQPSYIRVGGYCYMKCNENLTVFFAHIVIGTLSILVQHCNIRVYRIDRRSRRNNRHESQMSKDDFPVSL